MLPKRDRGRRIPRAARVPAFPLPGRPRNRPIEHVMAVLVAQWSECDVCVKALPRDSNLIGPATLANKEVRDPLRSQRGVLLEVSEHEMSAGRSEKMPVAGLGAADRDRCTTFLARGERVYDGNRRALSDSIARYRRTRRHLLTCSRNPSAVKGGGAGHKLRSSYTMRTSLGTGLEDHTRFRAQRSLGPSTWSLPASFDSMPCWINR